MNSKQSTPLAALLGCFLLTAPAHAEYKFGFLDTSINSLQWTPGKKARSGDSLTQPGKKNKQDLAYLEIEGGAEFSWGEFYGFGDLERVFNKKNIAILHSKAPYAITYH